MGQDMVVPVLRGQVLKPLLASKPIDRLALRMRPAPTQDILLRDIWVDMDVLPVRRDVGPVSAGIPWYLDLSKNGRLEKIVGRWIGKYEVHALSRAESLSTG